MDLGYPETSIDQSFLPNIGKIIEELIQKRLNHFSKTKKRFLCLST